MNKCNHKQCDICLKRFCHGIGMPQPIGRYRVCHACIQSAVKLSLELAKKFGGIYEDSCGYKTEEPVTLRAHAKGCA